MECERMEMDTAGPSHGKAKPTGNGGKLWSNILVDDTLESAMSDINQTSLDVRRKNGLEERGSETYLKQLVTRKKKAFVAPRVEKARVPFYWRGRGCARGRGMERGRGFGNERGRGRGLRGTGRGHGRIPNQHRVDVPIGGIGMDPDVESIESESGTDEDYRPRPRPPTPVNLEDLIVKSDPPKKEEEKPKTEEELKKEKLDNLKNIFGGGPRRRGHFQGLEKDFAAGKVVELPGSTAAATATGSVAASSGGSFGRGSAVPLPPSLPSVPKTRELVSYDDLDFF